MRSFWNEKKEMCYFVLFLIALYGAFRYVLPLFLPFVLAFCVVAPSDPLVSRISQKTHVPKGVVTGLLAAVLFTGIILIVTFLIYLSCNEIGNYVFSKQELLYHFKTYFSNLSKDLIPNAMNESIGYVQKAIRIFIFVIISWISMVLLSKDFSQLKKWGNHNQYVIYAKNEVRQLGLFIKTFAFAQFVIILGISAICFVGFVICGFPLARALLFGLLTGILDALPFLGTGLVLIPVAIWQLLIGNYSQTILILLLFLLSVVFRELLEPRLIGDKMGLWPVAMLMSVYVGVEVFGGLGVIYGPIYLIIATDFYRHAFTKSG